MSSRRLQDDDQSCSDHRQVVDDEPPTRRQRSLRVGTVEYASRLFPVLPPADVGGADHPRGGTEHRQLPLASWLAARPPTPRTNKACGPALALPAWPPPADRGTVPRGGIPGWRRQTRAGRPLRWPTPNRSHSALFSYSTHLHPVSTILIAAPNTLRPLPIRMSAPPKSWTAVVRMSARVVAAQACRRTPGGW
jgi:hypothetical protein